MDGMGNMHVGVDGAVAKMSSWGRWARDADSLGEMLGKKGAEGVPLMSLYHLPIISSGTEYHANKLLSILGPYILPLLCLFISPETSISPGDTTSYSSLQCRLFSSSRFHRPGGGVSVFLSATCSFQTTASSPCGF